MPPEDDGAMATGDMQNMQKKLVKIGPAIPEICSQKDRHAQTDWSQHAAPLPWQSIKMFSKISYMLSVYLLNNGSPISMNMPRPQAHRTCFIKCVNIQTKIRTQLSVELKQQLIKVLCTHQQHIIYAAVTSGTKLSMMWACFGDTLDNVCYT